MRFVDCRRCGGRLNPNIVCFGESVRKAHVKQGYSMVNGAKASSLTVFSG
jgi:NAD-dependent SIR2 family protein deacetylase